MKEEVKGEGSGAGEAAPEPERSIRRILVALDASENSAVALDAAGYLAAALDAELVGFYVEDTNLLRLPALPFAREVDQLSGQPRPLGPAELERQIKTEAEQLRRMVEQIAHSFRLRWSFRTSRGQVSRKLLEAAREADLITLGIRGRSPGAGTGSTFRAILEKAPLPVLIAHQGGRMGRAIHVVYDGTEGGMTSLTVGATLARRAELPLTVFLMSGKAPGLKEAGRVRRWLRERDTLARVVHLVRGETREIAAVLRDEGCGLMVVPRSLVGTGDASDPSLEILHLVQSLACPVLVVK